MPLSDKVAGAIMGTIFLFAGIGMLFALPEHWPWYRQVLFEVTIFGCSLVSFVLGFFGFPTPNK